MKYLLSLVFFFLLSPFSFAQGFSAPWDVSQTAAALAAQAERLSPLLDQLKPAEWKGAPEAYTTQAKGIRDEAGYLVDAANAFVKQPEKLSLAISTYFRMQSVEKMVDSLADGVRRYQDPRLGDELVTTVAANYGNRDLLRQYIADLAATREEEFKVIDNEAQRCRGDLLKQAPAPATPKTKATVK